MIKSIFKYYFNRLGWSLLKIFLASIPTSLVAMIVWNKFVYTNYEIGNILFLDFLCTFNIIFLITFAFSKVKSSKAKLNDAIKTIERERDCSKQ